jgi:putative two-component system response regulator
MNFQRVFEYTKNLHVLYVEDDEQLLKETRDVLEDFFSTVTTATNGKDALQEYQNYFDDNGFYYDLVITDINMPIMDGATLIQKIHKIFFDQVVIVISAYNDSSRLIELIQNGITNFVLKPIAPKQLMKILYKSCKNIVAHKNEYLYQLQLEDLNKNLDTKVKELSKEVLYTQQLSIETISDMVESYDDETGTHVKRIEKYTEILLSKVPQTEEFPRNLQEIAPLASMLHDIGKLFIPKEILTKPAKLDASEFEIIKEHAKLGGDVLKKANNTFKKEFSKDSYFKMASDISMYHHEKYDGTGYPEGLVGDAIPMCARIVAIADVYDALRSKRVYKKGFSHKDSVDIIRNESGKSFDPELVELFLKVHKEFKKIFLQFS